MTTSDSSIEIGALAGLDLSALRDKWRALWNSEPPVSMSRELLIQAIAYKIQEAALGGLSRATRRRLSNRSTDESRRRETPVAKPGTRLLRSWQGHTHEVTVTTSGKYSYKGAEYRSLSAIARVITGTRWSGPVFFGLKPLNARRHAGA